GRAGGPAVGAVADVATDVTAVPDGWSTSTTWYALLAGLRPSGIAAGRVAESGGTSLSWTDVSGAWAAMAPVGSVRMTWVSPVLALVASVPWSLSGTLRSALSGAWFPAANSGGGLTHR